MTPFRTRLKTIAFFSMIIGIGIIVSWIMILIQGDLPEGEIALGFHLFSEFFMAIVLLISGIMLFREMRWAKEINIGGLGMLIYSVTAAR
ncbi:MAG: hypothetical protein JXA23_00025 [Bacteroidales bacterium]|nr:hypothetical protein [Bacteroidales bacterium]